MAQTEIEVKGTILSDINLKFFKALINGGKVWQELVVELAKNPDLTQQLINFVHPILKLKPLQIAFLQEDVVAIEWLLQQGATLDSEVYFPMIIKLGENSCIKLRSNVATNIEKLISPRVGAFVYHALLSFLPVQAFALYNSAGEDKKMKARMALQVGSFYLHVSQEGGMDECRGYLEEAYELFKELGDECNQATAAFFLGKLFFKHQFEGITQKMIEDKFQEASTIYEKNQLPLFVAIVHSALAQEKLLRRAEPKSIYDDLTISQNQLVLSSKVSAESILVIQRVINTINLFGQAQVAMNNLIIANDKSPSGLINVLELFNKAFVQYAACKNLSNELALETIQKHVEYLLKIYNLIAKKINNLKTTPLVWLDFCIKLFGFLFSVNIKVFWRTPEQQNVDKSQTAWMACEEKINDGNHSAVGMFNTISFCMVTIFNCSLYEHIGMARELCKFLCASFLKDLYHSAKNTDKAFDERFSKKINERVYISRKLAFNNASHLWEALTLCFKYFLGLASGNSVYRKLTEKDEDTLTVETVIKISLAETGYKYDKSIINTVIWSSLLALATHYYSEVEDVDSICRLIECGVLGLGLKYEIYVSNRVVDCQRVKNHVQRDYIQQTDQEEYLFYWYEKLYQMIKNNYEAHLKKRADFSHASELGQYFFFCQEFLKNKENPDIYKLLAEPITFKTRTQQNELKTHTIKFGVLLARQMKVLAKYLKNSVNLGNQDKFFKAFADTFKFLKSVKDHKKLLAPAIKGCSLEGFVKFIKLPEFTLAQFIKEIRIEGMDIILSFTETTVREQIANILNQVWPDKKADIVSEKDNLDLKIKNFWLMPKRIFENFAKRLPRQKVTYELKQLSSVSYQPQKSTDSSDNTNQSVTDVRPKKDSSPIVGPGFWQTEESYSSDTESEKTEEFIFAEEFGDFELLSDPESALETPEPSTPVIEISSLNLKSLLAGLENLKKPWQIPISEIQLPQEERKDLYKKNQTLFDEIKVTLENLPPDSNTEKADRYSVLFDLIQIAVKLSRIGFGKIQSPFLKIEQIGYFRDIFCDQSELFLGKDDSYLKEALELCSDHIKPYANYIIDGTGPIEKIYCVDLAQHPKFKNISIEVPKELKKSPSLCIERMLDVIQELKRQPFTSLKSVAVALANLGNSVRMLRDHHGKFCSQHFNSRLALGTYQGNFKTENVYTNIADLLVELNAFRNRVTHDENFSLENYRHWVVAVKKDIHILEEKLLAIQNELEEKHNPSKDEENDEDMPSVPTLT